MRRKVRRCHWLAAALLLLAVTGRVLAAPFGDAFDGTSLDWCRWEDASYKGTVTQSGELVLSPGGSEKFGSAQVLSQARLVGDFDVQVDYRQGVGLSGPVTGPGYPQLNLTLGLFWNQTRQVLLSRSRTPAGDGVSVYASLAELMPNNSLWVPESATAGTLRMVRTGTQLTYHHRPNGSATWAQVGTMSVPATPVHVTLQAYHVDFARAFTGYFDNLQLNAGTSDDIDYAQPSMFKRRNDFAAGGVFETFPARNFWWWPVPYAAGEPFRLLRDNGMGWARVGMTTVSAPELSATPPDQWRTLGWQNHFWGSREYATETLKAAAAQGMRLYVYLYFSEVAANWGNQQAPPAWAGKSVAETATLVQQYAFETAQYLLQQGLNVEIFELGNEIDVGIIDFVPGRRIPVPPGVDAVNDYDWLRQNVWNIEAQLLKAARAGIKQANPSAKIAIHAASVEVGVGPQFGPQFYQAMRDFGLEYDYAAISLPYAQNGSWKLDRYPTACWFKRVARIADQIAVPGKPVMVVEASYQSSPETIVVQPMQDFPFTTQGQSDWLREQLRFASNRPSIAGWFYFYPDIFPSGVPPTDAIYVLEQGSVLATAATPRPALYQFNVNLNPAIGSGTIGVNPYGPVSVQGATLNGNVITSMQDSAVIQLGNVAGVAGSVAVFDFQAFNIGGGRSLTIRSGAPNQTVAISDKAGTASTIHGSLRAEGGNGAAPPTLHLNNPSGIIVGGGGAVIAPTGIVLDALGADWWTGESVVNRGAVDGGSRLEVMAAKVNGGGAFRGNAIGVHTFGNANNPVNGSDFLKNGLQLYPSTGNALALTIHGYGPGKQVFNLYAHGNATAWMPSAWPAGWTLPANNAVVAPGGVRPAGVPEPGYGGGSMILQASGALALVNGGTNDFAFPGAIALKAGGTLDFNGVAVNQGWTTSGQSFQGLFFEAPAIVSAGGLVHLYGNDLNWMNFSVLPQQYVRAFSLKRNPDGSASFAAADGTAPHLNTYSVIQGAAAAGGCWVCLVNTAPVNMYGP